MLRQYARTNHLNHPRAPSIYLARSALRWNRPNLLVQDSAARYGVEGGKRKEPVLDGKLLCLVHQLHSVHNGTQPFNTSDIGRLVPRAMHFFIWE